MSGSAKQAILASLEFTIKNLKIEEEYARQVEEAKGNEPGSDLSDLKIRVAKFMIAENGKKVFDNTPKETKQELGDALAYLTAEKIVGDIASHQGKNPEDIPQLIVDAAHDATKEAFDKNFVNAQAEQTAKPIELIKPEDRKIQTVRSFKKKDVDPANKKPIPKRDLSNPFSP